MSPRKALQSRFAFTLLELVSVIVLMALILTVLFLPQPGTAQNARTINCLSNQRQVALGFLIFATDYGDKYPWEVSATNRGSLEFADLGQVTPHYQTLSNYLKEPRLLLCPTEIKRNTAVNWAVATDTNFSYFLHFTAIRTNAHSPLLGDRHLEVNGRAVGPGLLTLDSSQKVAWTRELHNNASGIILGCMAFADGHVETSRTFERYPKSFPSLPANRLVLP